MTWLVIGSNSFSGANFCDHLLKAGIDVIGTSRSEEVALPFRPYAWQDRPGKFTYQQVDLNKDMDALDALFRQHRPSHVVNFAAQSMVGESWDNPTHWMHTNVVATVDLYERLRHLDWLDRYVHVTTPEVYGSTSGWVKEDHPFNPSTPYAMSRAAGDMALQVWNQAYDIPFVATRAANVYGPGQQLYRIIPRTILYAMTGQILQLHGGGYSERSFIHMDDVSDATQRIAENGVNGQTYHISTNDQISIRDLVKTILETLGKSFEDGINEVGERQGKDQSYQLDSTRLRTELGWTDRISVSDGVADVINWVRDNLDALQSLPQHYIHKP